MFDKHELPLKSQLPTAAVVSRNLGDLPDEDTCDKLCHARHAPRDRLGPAIVKLLLTTTPSLDQPTPPARQNTYLLLLVTERKCSPM